jgi:hypothetical protein
MHDLPTHTRRNKVRGSCHADKVYGRASLLAYASASVVPPSLCGLDSSVQSVRSTLIGRVPYHRAAFGILRCGGRVVHLVPQGCLYLCVLRFFFRFCFLVSFRSRSQRGFGLSSRSLSLSFMRVQGPGSSRYPRQVGGPVRYFFRGYSLRHPTRCLYSLLLRTSSLTRVFRLSGGGWVFR